MATIDVDSLRDKVKVMYQAVAEEPHGTFHKTCGVARPPAPAPIR